MTHGLTYPTRCYDGDQAGRNASKRHRGTGSHAQMNGASTGADGADGEDQSGGGGNRTRETFRTRAVHSWRGEGRMFGSVENPVATDPEVRS